MGAAWAAPLIDTTAMAAVANAAALIALRMFPPAGDCLQSRRHRINPEGRARHGRLCRHPRRPHECCSPPWSPPHTAATLSMLIETVTLDASQCANSGKVRALGITPVIARRGVEHGSGLGVHR